MITHYYSGPGEVPDTSVEEALANLDSVGADVAEKLELGAALQDEEPLVLAAYVTMLHGRVPPARDRQQKVLETFGALQVEMALANASAAEQAEIWPVPRPTGQRVDRLIAEQRSGATKVVHHPLATMRDRRRPRAPIVAEMPRMRSSESRRCSTLRPGGGPGAASRSAATHRCGRLVALRARKLHKRLHAHRTFDEQQVGLNEKAAGTAGETGKSRARVPRKKKESADDESPAVDGLARVGVPSVFPR